MCWEQRTCKRCGKDLVHAMQPRATLCMQCSRERGERTHINEFIDHVDHVRDGDVAKRSDGPADNARQRHRMCKQCCVHNHARIVIVVVVCVCMCVARTHICVRRCMHRRPHACEHIQSRGSKAAGGGKRARERERAKKIPTGANASNTHKTVRRTPLQDLATASLMFPPPCFRQLATALVTA